MKVGLADGSSISISVLIGILVILKSQFNGVADHFVENFMDTILIFLSAHIVRVRWQVHIVVYVNSPVTARLELLVLILSVNMFGFGSREKVILRGRG